MVIKMIYHQFSTSKDKVSSIGLGTMTFGEQTGISEAHNIIDLCIDYGINLIDTAEMYPVYPSNKTYGFSEEIIGKYLCNNKKRNKLFISTKFATSNPIGIGASKLNWIRGGNDGLSINKYNLEKGLNDSLKRLNVENIDLYQIHWPERLVSFGKKIEYNNLPMDADILVIREMLIILNMFIKEGKILNYGLSNETPWGLMKALSFCEEMNLIKPVSIQNQYNLINRSLDLGLKEVCLQEKISILAYGPLAGGLLSGKYLDYNRPKDARYTIWSGPKNKYFNNKIDEAISHYKKIAKNYDISLSTLAYSYIMKLEHISSLIVGFKNLDQAKEGLNSFEYSISEEIIEEIDEVHKELPNPYLEFHK